ncbi:MAG: antitoxin [Propionibacteriaceae bacterium]
MGLLDKAKEFISGHEDKAKEALDKAEQVIDEKTGDKYDAQTDKAREVISEKLGLND